MEPLALVYALLILWFSTYQADGVGPRLKSSDDRGFFAAEAHSQNVAILEELRTLTDLVLRYQPKAEGDEQTNVPVVHDCSTLRDAGIRASGVYSVFPFTFKVYCDMATDGGGWTVIQRRQPADIHEDFNQSWSNYRLGFGDLYNEFWLGLEPLHQLTYSAAYELRIDMVDYEHGPKHAHYKVIYVGPESDGYRLQVSNYTGNAGDALSLFHSGRRYSTFDRDQDLSRNKSCAQDKEGGWWFHACYAAHLNGVYPAKPKRETSSSEIRWWSNRENVLVLTSVEMKIRRRKERKQSEDTQEVAPDDDQEVTPEVDDPSTGVTANSSSSSEDSQTQNDTESHTDYDFKWRSSEDEILFADPNSGGTEDEYNVTDHGTRSDTNPWWISVFPGFD